MDMYDIAREIMDEVFGEGAYADMNKDHPDPKIREAAKRSEPWCTCGAKTPQGRFHKVGCPARDKADE